MAQHQTPGQTNNPPTSDDARARTQTDPPHHQTRPDQTRESHHPPAWRPPAPRRSARCSPGARRNVTAAPPRPPPHLPQPPPCPAFPAPPPLAPYPPPSADASTQLRHCTRRGRRRRRAPWRARPRGAASAGTAARRRRGSGRTARTTGTTPRYGHARSYMLPF